MCYGMNCLFEETSGCNVGTCTADSKLVDKFIKEKNLSNVTKCFIGGGELTTYEASDKEWKESMSLWNQLKEYEKHHYGGTVLKK